MYQKGYQQYKMQTIHTMTKGEMLLALYDELLKRLSRAKIALQEKDYGVFDKSVQRSREIVRYLEDTLNEEYAVSRDLMRMYGFFIYELGRLQAGRRPAVIDELQPLVIELRDAFKEASRKSGM